MSDKHRTLELKVVGSNDDDLEKLLEMALHELRTKRHHFGTGRRHAYQMEGSVGYYRMSYGLGSPELIEICETLTKDGYEESRIQGMFEDYADFVHGDKPPMRVFFNPVRAEEITEEERESF